MKRLLLIALFFQVALTAGLPITQKFHGPTEQLIKRESWKKIEKKLLEMHLPSALFPYFDSIADFEDWGHLGYHGAKQDYRIYQDVIRLTIEEIVGIPIREDFHFLRIPGDQDLNLNTMEDFEEYWGKVDNKDEIRAKQLLSMNFGIYSNFDREGSCSIYLFVKDKSKTKISYQKQLAPFFREIGISPTALSDLFAIGHKWLDDEGGILLQIGEHSHQTDPQEEAYNFADKEGYAAKKGGYLYGIEPLSTHFERLMSDNYVQKKINIAPQLRLLINNRYTLNPNSPLHIRRWDLYDPETVASYEQELRALIRSLKYDQSKMEKYQKKLLELWVE